MLQRLHRPPKGPTVARSLTGAKQRRLQSRLLAIAEQLQFARRLDPCPEVAAGLCNGHQRLRRAPQQRGSDGAHRYRQKRLRPPHAVAQPQPAVIPAHPQADAVAIAIRLGRSPDPNLRDVEQPSAQQRLAQDLLLHPKLCLIARHLVLAPAAHPKVHAARLNPVSRGLNHVYQPGCRRFRPLAEPYHLAGKRERHKDHLAGERTGQPIAAVDGFLDAQRLGGCPLVHASASLDPPNMRPSGLMGSSSASGM